MIPAPSLCGMTRGYGMGEPCHPSRFLTSPGLRPDTDTAILTSPGPGSGSGISPTTRVSRAGPRRSYQAARTGVLRLGNPGGGASVALVGAELGQGRAELLQ